MTIPIKPIYLLADSQLLFWKPEGVPWLQTVRDQLDKDQPKAAYIGASNGDLPEFFSIFEGAMEQVGITDCRMIYADYQSEDRVFLKEADLILLAGGDVGQGWRVIEQTGMSQDIIHKYYDQTVLMGISAGAVQLGLRGWSGEMPEHEDDTFETFKLIPYVLDAHDEANHWERLKRLVGIADDFTRGLGLPTGGGMIYHPDHTLEPIRHALTEMSGSKEEVAQNLLFPPDKDHQTGEETASQITLDSGSEN